MSADLFSHTLSLCFRCPPNYEGTQCETLKCSKGLIDCDGHCVSSAKICNQDVTCHSLKSEEIINYCGGTKGTLLFMNVKDVITSMFRQASRLPPADRDRFESFWGLKFFSLFHARDMLITTSFTKR